MTLRSRLTAYYIGFFAVALLVTGFTLYLVVRMMLERSVTDELQAGMAQVVSLYNNNPNRSVEEVVISNGVLQDIQLSGAPAGAFVNSNLYAQVFSPSGRLLGTSSPRGPDVALPDDALKLHPSESISDRRRVGATSVQVLIEPLVLKFNNQVIGILQISRPLTDIDETLRVLLYTLLGGGAVTLALAALGGTWLARAALEPIDQVTTMVQQIVRAEDLGRRVRVPTTQDEIQRLTVTINELLHRLDILFTAQRRFLADVSHELRTPLAAMHGNLEVLARGASRDPELLEESITDMRREASRLIRMVNDLLLLAQSEAGIQLRQEPVELDTLLLEVHRELRPLANGVQLRIGGEDQLMVIGDRDRIKQALLNLGINALQHTPVGGSVILSLAQEAGGATLAVRDTGPGIAPEVLPHLFERFYRGDPARNHNRGGAGLGLAIVKWIVETHGGRVGIVSQPGQGSTFTIWLPLPVALAPTTPLPALEHSPLHA
jgi:signal transduction histidine kinase